MKCSSARVALLIAAIVTLVSLLGTGCAPVSAVDAVQISDPVEMAAAEPPLSANTLHADLRLAPFRCGLPAIGMSAADQRQFVQTALDCLAKTWGATLSSAGMTVAPLELVVVDSVTSGCSKQVQPTDAAFYCGGRVYWPTDDPIHHGWGPLLPQYLLFVVMHEYGHHLQSSTGILRKADTDIGSAGEKSPLGLELSRRIELQAQCLAGVTLAAAQAGGLVTPSAAAELIEIQADTEEDPTHGTGTNSQRWAEAGYRSTSTSVCNTWAAAPDEVN
ncbi:neutral zinc metallopeptidase [Nocardia sp. NBC_00565]|uniref:neutral zinc metallopeptidase n=1 Tax=Nocardia sp. NBC_00565 TaxID=2975993 RepID=UPI002E81332D|nr:neutral zinc metallopeptidase [Nocardia sp. NBC_00565]WUC00902.1 neutral zinc metallopeptidase [Nocardia sp. NBC_00565]